MKAKTALVVALFSCLAGCLKDPYDPKTWIDKLDSAEWEKAVVELERLRDPVAISALGKQWEARNRDPKILRAMIDIAQKPRTGMKEMEPQWKDAVPYLIKAVDEYNVLEKRSIDDAVVAAEALGKAKDPSAVDALVRVASQELPRLSEGQKVRIAACQALGNFGSNPKAVDTLIRVLEMDPEKQLEHVNAAAANALAETGSDKALQPLLIALYKVPRIYRQVRGALVKLRATAAPELIKIMKGEHKAIEAFAKENNFANDCGTGEGPRTRCTAPGNLDFKAAAILGDMRSAEAVPTLVADLSDPAQIAFFNPRNGEPGPPDHTAVLDALRKLGAPAAAGPVLAYAKAEKTDDAVRPIAIDVFSFLARGTEGMDWLSAQMKDDAQDEEIRKASALAYGRLVYDSSQLEPIKWLVDRYNGKAVELEKQEKSAGDAVKKAELARDARGYRDLASLFDQHRARAVPGIKCKQDVACYMKILESKPSEMLDMLDIPKAEQDKLDRNVRDGYRIAVSERCLMELAKLGPKAAPAQNVLLDMAGSRDRIIRQGALLALPAVATRPCQPCLDKLKEVLKTQADNDTLSELNAETELVYEFFAAK